MENKQRFTVSTDLIHISGGVRKPTKSRRNRSKGRQLNTLNNKQNKLKSRYNRLSKGEKFKAKYPDFEGFLAVNNIKQMERTVEKTKVSSKSSYKGGEII